MKILFDLSFIRHNPYAGVSKYAYRILDYIVEEKLEDNVTLLLNSVSENYIVKLYPQFKFIVIGPSIFKPIPIVRTIWTSLTFRSVVNRSDFDVVFCSWGNEITCLKTNKKIISVVHDLQCRKDTKGLLNYLHKLIDDNIFRNSIKIVTISEYSKDDILKFYPQYSDKVVSLSNSVSLSSEISDRIINDSYILFVGRICELKNPLTLVKAYNIIKNNISHKLVLVGGKTEYWYKVVYPFICESGIKDRILLIEGSTEAELSSLYKYADLFVLPSLREGFGSPPVEAAIMNTSVIVSQCESLPEVTMNLTHSYKNSLDDNELAELMLKVMQNPDSGEKLEKIAKSFYRQYNIYDFGKRVYNFIAFNNSI